MEIASTEEVTNEMNHICSIKIEELDYNQVAGKQIMSALLHEVGQRGGAAGFFFKVLQGVANKARSRGLLINPNEWERINNSTAVGDPSKMLPSKWGWEMTKGILKKHLKDAEGMLRGILDARLKQSNKQ